MLSIYLNKDPQGRVTAGFSLTIISEPVFHKLLNSNFFILITPCSSRSCTNLYSAALTLLKLNSSEIIFKGLFLAGCFYNLLP